MLRCRSYWTATSGIRRLTALASPFTAPSRTVGAELIPLLVEYFRLAVFHRPSAIFHNPERVISEHRKIIEALQSRDAVAARQALLDHLHLRDFEA